jgi:enterochelin esterase-like enzyme
VPAVHGGLPNGRGDPSAQPHADGSPPTLAAGGQTQSSPDPANQATALPSGGLAPPAVPIEHGGILSITPGAEADLKSGHFPHRSGAMTVQQESLPAPWTGGTATTVDVYVVLPAGYDPQHERYPTVYLTPNSFGVWSHRFAAGSAIAQMAAAGDLPATIYVFAPAVGGPYPTSQCIDSADGREQWDTFMSSTLVTWVDSHYATIAEPAARTIVGSSQGAYCAADLLLRHPDVWHQEISFSGFYDAAPRTGPQAGNGAVYGGDPAIMDAYSPITIAPQVPADTRRQLFFVLAGFSSQEFFGPQMDQFAATLDQSGYARAVIEAPPGHSPKSVDQFLPRALSLVAARLVGESVIP